MSLAIQPLPEDPDALRRFAADLQAELARKDLEITARDAEIHAKTLHIEKLKMQLAMLRRARFGRSSEKLNHEIEQLELLIGELEEEQAEEKARAGVTDPELDDPADDQPSASHKARPRKRRAKFPAHLPRETVTHEPVCTCPGCGGTIFSRIGQDEREVLEYCKTACKCFQILECAPLSGQIERNGLTPLPGLPKDGSHGTTSFTQHRIQAAGRQPPARPRCLEARSRRAGNLASLRTRPTLPRLRPRARPSLAHRPCRAGKLGRSLGGHLGPSMVGRDDDNELVPRHKFGCPALDR